MKLLKKLSVILTLLKKVLIAKKLISELHYKITIIFITNKTF